MEWVLDPIPVTDSSKGTAERNHGSDENESQSETESPTEKTVDGETGEFDCETREIEIRVETESRQSEIAVQINREIERVGR